MSQKRFSIFLVFIYLLQDLIGTGNFCSVYKGVYERDANDEIVVAIKV